MSGVILVLFACVAPGALGQAASSPNVVMMIGEDEYHTWETLPEFAKSELSPRGMRVTIVQEDPHAKNHFAGLAEALSKADLLVLSTRRRLPPRNELDAVRAFLDSGKPLVGIRTACHAFAPRGKVPLPPGAASWIEFDPQVLGGHYDNHYDAGPKTEITLASGAENSPILAGVDIKQLVGSGSLYRVSPIDRSCEPLLIGTIPGKPAEPVAWTHRYGPNRSRVFYTSLGHPDDFKEPAFRKLLLNGILWALDPQSVAATQTETTLEPGRVAPVGPSGPSQRSAGLEPDRTDTVRLQRRVASDWPKARKLVPSPAVPSLNVVDNLRIEQVLAEPLIAKPLYINFDERGRLWLVQYRQYPWPAGLKLISHDNFYRNVYDPPFPPPPPFAGENARFRGRDMITIHESTHGDGVFDKTTVFLDGLNLATAALKGRGGVFVMNPPYLLFYPCTKDPDHPDSQTPQVLLSGFGIEDTHSIANSLRWGPDGWIYGANGSTVSAAVVRYGADGKPFPGEKPLHIMGQHIWRYQPETRRFEIFAEGGGNTFGVVFDSKGHLFSGHNGGDTRGFHYDQGGYYLKGFEKHGALSNPYAFGYINPLRHAKVDRFTHTFAIYEGGTFPAEYNGKMFALAPHRHYVICTELIPLGSTFRTQDMQKVITPGDQPQDDYFTPVDIQLGPDGALYIVDWRARQANHYRSSEGQTNPDLGRVYRLAGEEPSAWKSFDLAQLSSAQLIERYLKDPNRWYREQALRLLGDRKDRSVVPMLRKLVRENTGELALNALWALNLSGGLDESFGLTALAHQDPDVRRWAVRLIGDNRAASPQEAQMLASMARSEPDDEVRCQLASGARRLATPHALPILANLLGRDEDAADIQIPKMIWWALEAHANDREAILSAFADQKLWRAKLRPDGSSMTEYLVRRWAMAGSRQDLVACARLMNLSPGESDTQRLVTGFERAFEGRPIPPLPDSLADALAKVGGDFAILLGVRRGDPQAADAALARIGSVKTPLSNRLELIAAIGDLQAKPQQSIPLLLDLSRKAGDDSLRGACLVALERFNDPSIGSKVIEMYGALPPAVQNAAQSLLASRLEWTRLLMRAIDTGTIKSHTIDPATVDKLRLYEDAEVAKLVSQQFPMTPATAAELDEKIGRYARIIRAGGGQPLAGKELFHGKVGCANCHTVFGKGGRIGPDLTSYDRANLDSMLLAIVNPSAEIREGFETYLITTKDGRALNGFKVEENDQAFVIRGIDGQNIVIPIDQIRSRKVSPRSLMPEGLLDALSDQELRDLFAFLASTTPPL